MGDAEKEYAENGTRALWRSIHGHVTPRSQTVYWSLLEIR